MVDKRADACYGCHSGTQLFDRPRTRETFRIYNMGQERVMGLVRPIENEPACSNASCHAHSPGKRILGVLDVVLSLEQVDRALAQHERRMRAQVGVSAALMIAIGGAAYLVAKAIRAARVVAFKDLGMEAIHEFDVKDMPVTVAVDTNGNAVHESGPREWRER